MKAPAHGPVPFTRYPSPWTLTEGDDEEPGTIGIILDRPSGSRELAPI